MTDEEKKKKREKSWFEEFLYNVMMECARQVMDYFFDEVIGWTAGSQNNRYIDYDEITEEDLNDEWDFW